MHNQTVALVSGGNRGLGFALCKLLATESTIVYMGSRDLKDGALQAQQIKGDVRVVELDVTNPLTIKTAVATISSEVGKIDLLFNNAGIYPKGDENPLLQTVSNLSATLAVNVEGVHSMIQACIPLLKKGDHAAIINISSGLGSLDLCSGWNFTSICYSTSKAALNMLSLQWSHVLTPMGIHICMVSPGWMNTDMGRPDAKPPEAGARIVLKAALRTRQGMNKVFVGEAGTIPW